MIFLNTHIVSKSNGLYTQQAQKNLSKLKTIMKNLIIKETPKDDTIWASDKTATIKSGGTVWIKPTGYRGFTPIKKKESKKVPTFAL